MMAEVAGRGQERRAAVFVAAIAGDRLRRGERRVDQRAVLVVEGEGEDAEIVGAVLALAEPRADDDGGDRRLLEHPARRDIGDRDAMLAAQPAETASRMLLKHVPAADLHRRSACISSCSSRRCRLRAGSGLPSHFSVRSPPASVP